MGEVRVAKEGNLYWVAASGSGTTWVTASAAASALLGFCSNFRFTSGFQVEVIRNRGVPSHNKNVGVDPIQLSFDVMWANSANMPTGVSGSGASVPMIHLEYKMTAPEAGAGQYYQFMGIPLNNIQFQEAERGNTMTYTCQALAMSGVNSSGFCG